MNRIKLITLMLLLSGLILTAPLVLAAGDPAKGKMLHDANCTACHTKLMDGKPTAIFTRPNSIIHSLDSLNKRVRFCETMNGLSWGDEQIGNVVAYLNKDFYKFK